MDLSKFLFTKGHDLSNHDIAIDHTACIVCDAGEEQIPRRCERSGNITRDWPRPDRQANDR